MKVNLPSEIQHEVEDVFAAIGMGSRTDKTGIPLNHSICMMAPGTRVMDNKFDAQGFHKAPCSEAVCIRRAASRDRHP